MGKGLRGPGTRRDEALAALAHGGRLPDDATPADPPADPDDGSREPDPGTTDSDTGRQSTPDPGGVSPGAPGPADHPMLATDLDVPERQAPTASRRRPPSGVTHAASRPFRMPQRRIVIRTRPAVAPGGGVRRPRPPRGGRRPGIGLPLLVVLGLLALFVSWVSAEPFWLAVGHQDTGAVKVTRCAGQGDLGTRCVGTFSATDRRYAVDLATVSGADTTDRRVGRTMPARMVSEKGRIAYVGDLAGLHVRWLTGLGLLLVIGLGIAAVTGAWRFRGTARSAAVLGSVLGPFLLSGVVLALTY